MSRLFSASAHKVAGRIHWLPMTTETTAHPTSDGPAEVTAEVTADLNGAVDKSGRKIQQMFAGVAPRYDLLNHLLSGSLDYWWRRRAATVLAVQPGEEVLDLCCGTGDQAALLMRRGARVVGADFCLPMLRLAQPKLRRAGRKERPFSPHLTAADALSLPFGSGRFSAATVSFGLRNVADLDRSLAELCRVLLPGGRLVILEFTIPERRWVRAAYLFYFRKILPQIGRLISPRGWAYSYLPDSVVEFPQRQPFLDRMAAAGFAELRCENLSAGTVCIYSGCKLSGHNPSPGES